MMLQSGRIGFLRRMVGGIGLSSIILGMTVTCVMAVPNSLKNTNVWIISHTPEKLENYVRGYISLDKVDGFTTIQQNK